MNNVPENQTKYYPLTHAQKRIYYEEKMSPGTDFANIALVVKYKESMDLNLLEKAINKAIL